MLPIKFLLEYYPYSIFSNNGGELIFSLSPRKKSLPIIKISKDIQLSNCQGDNDENGDILLLTKEIVTNKGNLLSYQTRLPILKLLRLIHQNVIYEDSYFQINSTLGYKDSNITNLITLNNIDIPEGISGFCCLESHLNIGQEPYHGLSNFNFTTEDISLSILMQNFENPKVATKFYLKVTINHDHIYFSAYPNEDFSNLTFYMEIPSFYFLFYNMYQSKYGNYIILDNSHYIPPLDLEICSQTKQTQPQVEFIQRQTI